MKIEQAHYKHIEAVSLARAETENDFQIVTTNSNKEILSYDMEKLIYLPKLVYYKSIFNERIP